MLQNYEQSGDEMGYLGRMGINLQLVDVIYAWSKAGRALSLLPAPIVHACTDF